MAFDPVRWLHVAVTWAGPGDGAVVMYVDGEPVDSQNHEGSLNDALYQPQDRLLGLGRPASWSAVKSAFRP